MPLALDHDPASGTQFSVIIFILSFFFWLSLSDLRGAAKQLHRGGSVAFFTSNEIRKQIPLLRGLN